MSPRLPKIWEYRLAEKDHKNSDRAFTAAKAKLDEMKLARVGDLFAPKGGSDGHHIFLLIGQKRLEELPVDSQGNAYLLPRALHDGLREDHLMTDLLLAYARPGLQHFLMPLDMQNKQSLKVNKSGHVTSLLGIDLHKSSQTRVMTDETYEVEVFPPYKSLFASELTADVATLGSESDADDLTVSSEDVSDGSDASYAPSSEDDSAESESESEGDSESETEVSVDDVEVVVPSKQVTSDSDSDSDTDESEREAETDNSEAEDPDRAMIRRLIQAKTTAFPALKELPTGVTYATMGAWLVKNRINVNNPSHHSSVKHALKALIEKKVAFDF